MHNAYIRIRRRIMAMEKHYELIDPAFCVGTYLIGFGAYDFKCDRLHMLSQGR